MSLAAMKAINYRRLRLPVWAASFLLWLLLPGLTAEGQAVTDSVHIAAGPEYARSRAHEWFWGKHYRKEWATPVRVPSIRLDTIAGGLVPYKAGGGRQSKSLRLKDSGGHEYVLRSIDKRLGEALPDLARNTFLEDIMNDQVSSGHPYSALMVTDMADRTGVYHTIPVIGFLPRQPALDSFNGEFGNTFYLLEQRPDENWENAANFGNAKKITGTDKLLEKTLEDNDNQVDQEAFARARLFDMLIGDWGRHEDQWRWAKTDIGDGNIYRPIPRDRDQAFTRYDGLLVSLLIRMADLRHLQTFDDKIKDIKRLNYPARNLDHRFLNGLNLAQWQQIAAGMQKAITDSVIERAVRQMPAEVYPISGQEISSHLKSRRDRLQEYAADYYRFLAEEVDVPGTAQRDYFEVMRLNDEETSVAVYKIAKSGERAEQPYYLRVFKTGETEEVRLYGIAGKDIFRVDGSTGKGIKIRMIGGPGRDTIIDRSSVGQTGRQTHIYDDRDNYFVRSDETRLHLSGDSAIHRYEYASFHYGRSKFVAGVSYSNADRLYVKAGYRYINRRWRKEPFGNAQGIYLAYSITQNAFSLIYGGEFNHLLGKWNLKLDASLDPIRWTNYFGRGNETIYARNKLYYRLRTREGLVSAGFNRDLGTHHNIGVYGSYQAVQIIDDRNRYINETVTPYDPDAFLTQHFAGGRLEYTFRDVDDPVLPTCGAALSLGLGYTANLRNLDSGYSRYSGRFDFYIPLIAHFGIAIRAGGTTIVGNPEFYQYASVGGSQSLRGYPRDRFWGRTMVYTSNELQWLPDFKSYLFNGKAGLFALYDIGRVWEDGEHSDLLHRAWGGGIILAPFNKFAISLAYAISEENRLFHIRVNRSL